MYKFVACDDLVITKINASRYVRETPQMKIYRHIIFDGFRGHSKLPPTKTIITCRKLAHLLQLVEIEKLHHD